MLEADANILLNSKERYTEKRCTPEVLLDVCCIRDSRLRGLASTVGMKKDSKSCGSQSANNTTRNRERDEGPSRFPSPRSGKVDMWADGVKGPFRSGSSRVFHRMCSRLTS